jgi:hypothetical protein
MRLPAAPRPVRARQAVPPGPVGYDLQAPLLLLHAVQTAEAYEALHRDGVLRCPQGPVEPEFEADTPYGRFVVLGNPWRAVFSVMQVSDGS